MYDDSIAVFCIIYSLSVKSIVLALRTFKRFTYLIWFMIAFYIYVESWQVQFENIFVSSVCVYKSLSAFLCELIMNWLVN